MTEEMKIKMIEKEIKKQVKILIEWGEIEDMKDVATYIANINIRKAEEAMKASENF